MDDSSLLAGNKWPEEKDAPAPGETEVCTGCVNCGRALDVVCGLGGALLLLLVEEGRLSLEDPACLHLPEFSEGERASINGATQIRAGVIRPEVVVTDDERELSSERYVPPEPEGISMGGRVRGIRAPYFGEIGRVKSLPVELMKMESETLVRIMEVEFADGKSAMLPRANVESIEE